MTSSGSRGSGYGSSKHEMAPYNSVYDKRWAEWQPSDGRFRELDNQSVESDRTSWSDPSSQGAANENNHSERGSRHHHEWNDRRGDGMEVVRIGDSPSRGTFYGPRYPRLSPSHTFTGVPHVSHQSDNDGSRRGGSQMHRRGYDDFASLSARSWHSGASYSSGWDTSRQGNSRYSYRTDDDWQSNGSYGSYTNQNSYHSGTMSSHLDYDDESEDGSSSVSSGSYDESDDIEVYDSDGMESDISSVLDESDREDYYYYDY